jgi:NADH oxidase (H2O2-forming)
MRFVIVGNGIAGISAAHAIRMTSNDALITIVSDEAEPAYSACLLADYIGGKLNRDNVIIKNFFEYSRDRISLLSSQKVVGMSVKDKRVILENESLPYDKVIIATGSKPVIPAGIAIDKSGIFTFKSLKDADKISRWKGHVAVIVGSGPIGLEAGMALKRKGYRVIILELLSHVLPKAFDEHPAAIIKSLLEQRGIEVLEREKLVEIVGKDSVSGVMTDKRTITCDTVVLATGMKPRGSWVIGKVDIGKHGGILVSDTMATSLPDVFACGDCVDARDLVTGRSAPSMLWHNARRQGEVAGYNAAGISVNCDGSLNVTGVTIFGTQAVSIGIGSSDGLSGLEVIERKGEGAYQRVLLQNSEVVGAQSVNWSEDMGRLLTSMVRKEIVGASVDALTKKRVPPRTMRPFAYVQK